MQMDNGETERERFTRLQARLSVEQRTFCEEYLLSQDARYAYKQAFGVDNRGRAFALLEHWAVKEYMAALLGEGAVSDDAVLSRAEIISTLRGIMRDGKAKDQDRIKAAEVAAKVLGIAEVKRHELSGPGGRAIQVEGISKRQVVDIRARVLGIDPAVLELDSASE